MGDTARALGAPAIVKFEDKEYKLGPINGDVESAFEIYLEDIGWNKALSRAARIPIEMGDRLLAAENSTAAMGHYTFGGKAFQQAIQTPRHMKHLYYLMLLENHNDMTFDVVERMYDQIRGQLDRGLDNVTVDPTTAPTPTPDRG